MNISDRISLMALVVAIISIVLSIINMVIQAKINRVNLEAKYYEIVFNPFILDKIPEQVAALKFDLAGKLNSNYKDLNDVIMKMVRKARYFKYSNGKFYKDLVDEAKELEDLLCDAANDKITTQVMQKKKLGEIDDKISEIIILINRNYSKMR